MDNNQVFSGIISGSAPQSQPHPSDENPSGQGQGMPPSVSPVLPTPSGRGKRWVKFLLLGVLGVVVLLVVAVLVFFTFLPERTVFGFNLADRAWEKFIKNGLTDSAQRTLTYDYTDQGEFNFVPSEIARKVDEASQDPYITYEDYVQEFDSELSFYLKDLHAYNTLSGYWNFKDAQNAVFDINTSSKLANNSKEYEANLQAKYMGEDLYVKPGVNDLVRQRYEDLAKQWSLKDGFWDQIFDHWIHFNEASWLSGVFAGGLSERGPLGDAQAQARDAKRISDMRQMVSVLELYFNDCGEYPAGTGIVLGLGAKTLVSPLELGDSCEGYGFGSEKEGKSFLGVVPTAPTPADGTCSEEINTYRYSGKQVDGRYQGYELTTCLGGPTGGFEAGPIMSSEAGITHLDQCPSGLSCEKEGVDQKVGVKEDEISPAKSAVLANRPFKLGGLKGVSVVDGSLTLHYVVELDKEKLKTMLLESISAEAKAQDSYDVQEMQVLERVVGILVGRFEVRSFDAWIGLGDQKVKKVEFESSAVSMAGMLNFAVDELTSGGLRELFVGAAQDSAEALSQDAKRLADVRYTASALELFYNDHEGYPDSDGAGHAFGLVPTYIADIREAGPDFSEPCNEYENTFWYTAQGKPTGTSVYEGTGRPVYNDYTFSFCLSHSVAGYAAGSYELTPAGIRPKEQCSVDSGCTKGEFLDETTAPVQTNSSNTQEVFYDYVYSFLERMPYTASLKLSYTASDFGKEKQVEKPETSTYYKDIKLEYDFGPDEFMVPEGANE